MAGIPARAASSTMRRKSTVLPEPEPAMIAVWRGSSRVGRLTGSSSIPMRRPTGMESVHCAVGAAAAKGAVSGAAGAGETVTAADSFGITAATGVSADGLRGVLPTGAGVSGAGLRPASLKNRVANNGLLARSQDSKASSLLSASQKPAASLGSGIKLVAQARKYGLGMIVATQVPRGIHNQVVSNCTTQFFGKQSAPATIAAAQDIIAASGGRADDIGKLKAGEFYFATEGSEKPVKLRTPICLTFHPPNPPTPDEVIALAKLSATKSRNKYAP
jgi:hypothetical protein